MLVDQDLLFLFQFGDLRVDVLDFLFDVVVGLLQQLFRFGTVRCRRVAPRSGLLAVSFMYRPVIRPITATTIR